MLATGSRSGSAAVKVSGSRVTRWRASGRSDVPNDERDCVRNREAYKSPLELCCDGQGFKCVVCRGI